MTARSNRGGSPAGPARSGNAPHGEFEWIARLVDVLGESAGKDGAIGDDAAVIATSSGESWVWTIDTLVEGVHFRFDWLAAEAVGHRALAASLSDLAAMGAEPAGALVAVAGPAGAVAAHLEGIYRGIAALSRRAGCPILGGDLSRADGPLHLTVTAIGHCVDGPPLRRDAARPGDEVWLTGTLGGPAAALALLTAGKPLADVGPLAVYDRLSQPAPRNAEVRWLGARAALHAAIDLSDGLSGDLGHVAARSGVRIEIEAERIPIQPAAREAARRLGRDPLDWALHGGEEFELVVSAPAGVIAPLADSFAGAFGIPLTRIGRVADGAGVMLVRDGAAVTLESRAWDHFAIS